MRLRVYQAPFEQTALGFAPTADYQVIYEDNIRSRTPEEVWVFLQRVDEVNGPWPPPDYHGRSLSVGDVIELDGVMWTPLMAGWGQLPDRLAEYVRSYTQPAGGDHQTDPRS
jgi:hypothetical protein